MRNYLLGLFLFVCGISFLLFLPWTTRLSSTVVNAGDPLFYAWNIAHNAYSFSHGLTNLLDTNIFYPETNTLAYSDTLFIQSLITAPVYWITHNSIFAENLYILLTFPLTALAMFVLIVEITKNKSVSFVGSLFFTFSYSRLSQIGHVPMVSTQFLPLFFLFLIRYFRSGSWKDAFLTMIFFVCSVASSIYFGVMVGILGALLGVCSVFVIKRKFILGRSIKIIIACIPTFVLLVVLLFPYIRFKVENPTLSRSLEESSTYSSHPINYITVLPSSVISTLGLPKQTGEWAAFPTLTVVILACIGLWYGYKKRKADTLILGLVGFVSLLFSFGPELTIKLWQYVRFTMPYYYLYQIFPPLQIIRVPARFSLFFVLFLTVFASFGIEALLTKVARRHYKILLFCIAGLFFIEVWQQPMQTVLVPQQKQIPEVYLWLAKQDYGVVAELPLTPMHWGNKADVQLVKEYKNITVNDMLVNETYRTYFSIFHKKPMINGYSGYFPASYLSAAFRLASFPSEDSLEFIASRNIRYIIVHFWEYTAENQASLSALLQANPSLHLLQSFGQDMVYELQ
jgi:hypothetical protein